VIIDARKVIVRKGEPVDRAIKTLKKSWTTRGSRGSPPLRAFETPSQKLAGKARANAKRARMKFRFNA